MNKKEVCQLWKRNGMLCADVCSACSSKFTASQPELPLERKRAGQARAISHLDPAYLAMFNKALRELIESRQGFTIDDVIEKIGLPFESGKNNSIGGLITRAAADGLIEKCGFATARRPESHGRIVHRWIGVRK